MATLCSASIQAEYQSPKGKSFGVAQGLSQLSVLDIEQDSKGFIWLATQAGVDRFNGSEFAYIGTNTALTKGLPANFVNRLLYDDKNDELFIATINGGGARGPAACARSSRFE